MEELVISVKKISRQECDQIARIEAAVFSDAWSKNAILESLSQKNVIIAGAFKDDQLIGYMIVYYVLDEAEIARIAVDEEHRRKGAAWMMMKWLEQFCLDHEIKEILLDVRESNAGARAFYRKCGFRENGIRKNFYTGPVEHAVLMDHRLE